MRGQDVYATNIELNMDHSPRRMSEISHLFLSDVRDKQTGGAPRPTRTPPGGFRGDVSIDLTPEEYAEAFSEAESETKSSEAVSSERESIDESTTSFKPVSVVLAHHLGERMPDRVREYAVSLCDGDTRVGIVYANAANIRIACIDRHDHGEIDEIETESFDADHARETLVELNSDIAQWLIVLPDPRDAQARELLKGIKHWTLLTGVDHDSIVSGYRTIKGLADLGRPELAIAIFDAESEQDVEKTRQKLAGVCEQFLHLNITTATAISANSTAAEHGLLEAMVTTDAGTGPWDILSDLVKHASPTIAKPVVATKQPQQDIRRETAMPFNLESPVHVSIPAKPDITGPIPMPIEKADAMSFEQIIDLPDANVSPVAIIQAVVKGGTDLVESPIKAPAFPDATIAVSRDHQLVLLAVAKQGLAELRSIATAYRWMNENRTLIAMAVPQFSIDAHAMPQLRLLVDHADATADVLQPLLATGNVTVQAYRKLRWGAKTGLLLEAA